MAQPLPFARGASGIVVRCFFVHIPKTAGTSFRHFADAYFPRQARFPRRLEMPRGHYPAMSELKHIPQQRFRRAQFFRGHYFAQHSAWFGADVQAITMLRDPVQRALSSLRHMQKHIPQHRHQSIDELAEQSLTLQTQVYNLQVRVLGLRFKVEDPAAWPYDIHAAVEVGERELEQAKAVLEAMPFFGLCEQFAQSAELFSRILQPQQNKPTLQQPRLNVTRGEELISEQTKTTLRACNQLDQELYDYATTLFQRRLQQNESAAVPP